RAGGVRACDPAARMDRHRDQGEYGTGTDDGLAPLASLDVTASGGVDALVRAMGQTAFGGRRLSRAADVLEAMVRDEACFRVLTISGAMTIAQQSLLLSHIID